MSKGMRLNMSRGKTEAMLTYVGPGAKEARELMRRDSRLPLEGDGERSFSLGSQYKHLGTTLTSGGKLGQEVKRRVGLAWGAFRTTARQVFTNVALKEKARLFLVERLIFTKLYYGCGSWPLLQNGDLRRLQVCQGNILRRTPPEQSEREGSLNGH